MRMKISVATAWLLLAVAATCRADIDQLQQSFAHPPDDARIMVRWWWFGPAVTKPELEREMKLMKEGGIGGFEVQPTYPLALDDEKPGLRNLAFLSPEFLDCLSFTAQKAKELGLRFDLTLGSGWPYGGPMIPITEAAAKLRIESMRFTAGARTVNLPRIGDGERLIAAFIDGRQLLAQAQGNAMPLPAEVKAPGEAMFFIASRTRQTVKRPAFGAEGYVLDHYDPAAVDNFIKNVADVELKAVAANPPHAAFCDSLEVYGNDWTGDLLSEFQKRRGYDLLPHLPALLGNL
ncbi:MAG TPA: glycosyl hydrolase, partial [Tepidisphaeraceae bacterium]